MTDLAYLSSAWYGKDTVRVNRVAREGSTHIVVEYNVKVLLEGVIGVSCTEADNGVIVATDSGERNLAKVSPNILVPEWFAVHLGTHIVSGYAHIHKAFVDIAQPRWSRIVVGKDRKPHPHSFFRDGDEKRTMKVEIDGTAGKDKIQAHVSAGVNDLLVLKSSGSSFTSFIRDEYTYTLLKEVDDRIFSTSVDLNYTFAPISISPSKDENAGVQSASYALPNKHYIPVDMGYMGEDNLTPTKAEVFQPVAAPRYELVIIYPSQIMSLMVQTGLISATVSRK
ncbi:uricase [Lentinula lateritia]|uniref:Uricase n=1 Tax=Lentinula aff. lateritia TaxID=2804960 RepID=A0ACC1TSL3_9AGAR|nr:uricase [Lentinula aff. lateritia]KAJ3852070.1 uricase [Lentinula lateritia]